MGESIQSEKDNGRLNAMKPMDSVDLSARMHFSCVPFVPCHACVTFFPCHAPVTIVHRCHARVTFVHIVHPVHIVHIVRRHHAPVTAVHSLLITKIRKVPNEEHQSMTENSAHFAKHFTYVPISLPEETEATPHTPENIFEYPGFYMKVKTKILKQQDAFGAKSGLFVPN